jgi:hypothetical protein
MTLYERLDTRINLQNLLSALAIAGGLIAWAMRIDSRISVLEEAKKSQEIRDTLQDTESNRRQDQILMAVKDLGAKVDRIGSRR